MRDGCVISDCQDSTAADTLVHSSDLPLKLISVFHYLDSGLICIWCVVSFVFAREACAKQVGSRGLRELLPADLLRVPILNHWTYKLIQDLELLI